MKTGIVIDERYLRHDPGYGHPERPERIRTLLEMVEEQRRPGLVRIDPRPATEAELVLNHAPELVSRVAATAGRDGYSFDPDTRTSAESYETALLATGGLLELIDAIVKREVDNGFALVRPPGHHAEFDRAMGFCLFNNVAIAARVLRQRYGLERILIMDWDLHHGNGTQHSFYDDPNVLYISTHQYPYYPGTGAAEESGRAAGQGYTVNIPLSAGCGDAELAEVFTRIVSPIARQFHPQFVLISAGFDCHRRDPLGGLEATEEGIGMMTRVLLDSAVSEAEGRLAAVLEGGYDLLAVNRCAARVLEGLEGKASAGSLPSASAGPISERVIEVQRAYWDLPAAGS